MHKLKRYFKIVSKVMIFQHGLSPSLIRKHTLMHYATSYLLYYLIFWIKHMYKYFILGMIKLKRINIMSNIKEENKKNFAIFF